MILWKNWNKKPGPDKAVVDTLADSMKVTHTIATLVAQKGLTTYDEAKKYFNPSPDDLHDPFLMKGMDKAVERIIKALENKEYIMVYGDYDVDGTTAVAVVFKFLNKLCSKLMYYVPDRFTEGYGISLKGMEVAVKKGVKLVIALDCGIKDLKAIGYAADHNTDVIVCDHHEPGEDLPQACAILNPKQKDCTYPFKELSGCGIGFKLIQALKTKLVTAPDPLSLVDYVAVSIASDIVPMVGENRVIEYLGLKKINTNPSLPFKTMLEVLDVKKPELEVSDLVFIIGPRLNASGRMEHADKTVEFLVGDEEGQVKKSVIKINSNNVDRKAKDQDIANQAIHMIETDEKLLNRKTTVLYDLDWHKGVIGIVASRVIEQFYRPTVLFTGNEKVLSGSARSVPGFNLYQAIEKCSDLLLRFGGHAFAAGLSLRKENFDEFSERFEKIVSETIDPNCLIPSLDYDTELELQEVNLRFNNTIRRFGPFGPENMKPVFVSKNVFLKYKPRIVGETHLKLAIALENNGFIDAIGFGMGPLIEYIESGSPLDMCYTVDENEWNGKRSVQLMLKDIRTEKLRKTAGKSY